MATSKKSKRVPTLRVVHSAKVSSLPVKPVINELCNWANPNLIVKNTRRKGLGVFSTTNITPGDLVVVFGGRVLTSEQLSLMPEGLDMLFQIEEDLFYIPVNLDSLGTAERINHSCNPNCGFIGQMSVAAIKPIAAGDEITIDYATCDTRKDFGFRCHCGAADCRKNITGDDWKIGSLQESLGRYFQPFLQRRLALATNDLKKLSNF